MALAASAFYISFNVSIDPSFYAAVFVAIGLACTLFGQTRKSVSWWCWLTLGGLIVGLAFVTKPSILLEIPALCFILFLKRRHFSDVALFLGAAAIAVASANLYFILQGDWYEMLYVSLGENMAYIGNTLFNLRLTGNPPNRWTFFTTLFLPHTLPYYGGLLIAAFSVHINALLKKDNRSTLLLALSAWFFLALLNSFLAIAMEVRYFSHIIAPAAMLFALSYKEIFQKRFVRIPVFISFLLLIVPFVKPSLIRYAHFYSTADFQSSIDFLDKNLQPQQCILTWGAIRGINLLSDHPSCNRVAFDGTMMIQEVYDIDQMRSWYLSDAIQYKPTILAQESSWGLFPTLQRLVDNHSTRTLFTDTTLGNVYSGLNWANFYPSDANINDEIDLLVYAIIPGRHVMPGHDLSVTLYWNVTHPPRAEYQGFVHLL